MTQEQRGYEHHVVGTVHEIVLIDPEPDVLRSALTHEHEECKATRIVIDLSHIDPVTDEIIEEVTVLVDDRPSMVRFQAGESLVPVGELSGS